MVEVVYYTKTARGGTYLRRTGMVSRIDLIDRTLTIVKTPIPFADLYDIEKKPELSVEKSSVHM